MENKTLQNEQNANSDLGAVSGCAYDKPKKEKYGWQDGGIYEDTGWIIEGGEEAYYEALKKWEDAQRHCH
jgi:hypothetical protein